MTQAGQTPAPAPVDRMGIRGVVHKDASAVAELLQELGYPMSLDDVHARLRALEGERTTKVLVADDGGVIAGLVVVHWFELLEKPGPYARLQALVVRRGYRGTGVGKKLVESAETVARRSGCLGIEVTTGAQRERSQSFYEQFGFETGESRYYRKRLT